MYRLVYSLTRDTTCDRIGCAVAAVAQVVEHLTENQGVPSSNLGCGTQSRIAAIMRAWLSGRASPCQGEGRGFESHRPLCLQRAVQHGDVAKWKGSGLQNRDHGFKSRRRLLKIGLIAPPCRSLSAICCHPRGGGGMADAADLKSAGEYPVWVRIPPALLSQS